MHYEKKQLISKIKRLSELLDSQYSYELNFRNHCYLRIAFDNTIEEKWDLKIKKPFIKYASENQLQNVFILLNQYLVNKQLLLTDNKKSLSFRENDKKNEIINNPKLF